ncbi:MAG: hypothetical protein E6Y37_18750, partial [Enterobacter hormaechei]|nr:hypothetical protein [Enterobacter hormaechei]
MVSSSLLVRLKAPTSDTTGLTSLSFRLSTNGWQTSAMMSWFFSYPRSDYHRANLKSDMVFCS